jgi:hypothetical protein
MKIEIKQKLDENPKYKELLRLNSHWYKILNRDHTKYEEFVKEMKIKYKLRTIDKIDKTIDTIDLITKIVSIK